MTKTESRPVEACRKLPKPVGSRRRRRRLSTAVGGSRCLSIPVDACRCLSVGLPFVACLLAAWLAAGAALGQQLHVPGGRTVFFLDEPIRLHLPSDRPDGQPVEITLRNRAGAALAATATAQGGRAALEIPAASLAAGPLFGETFGAWTAAAEGKTFDFTVVNGIPNTPFAIAMYGGDIFNPDVNSFGGVGPLPVEQRQRLYRDVYGINLMMHTGHFGGPLQVFQAERIARFGARIVAQHAIAGQHQPGGTSTSWAEPGVQLGCRYRASWSAQAWRRIAGTPFAGVHYADEPGLTWGGQNAEGKMRLIFPNEQDFYTGPFAVPAQHDAYRRATGREPADWRHPERDWDGWRDFQRFRLTILGDLFRDITNTVHRIDPNLLGYSQVYAWRTTAEGIYPPEMAKGIDVLSTHGYAMWTPLGHLNPAFEVDAMRSGAWNKPLWMLGPWMGHQAETGGVRAVLYGLLARKVEGIIWPLDWLRAWPEAEEVSRKILPLSGMLHDTRKPRDQVALFHSLDEHLQVNAENLRTPNPGQQYHGRMLSAWWNINAAGFPVSWLTEEDILAGVLEQVKVVVAPRLTRLRPEMREPLAHFIADGGTVLLDAASTVDLPGATRLRAEFKNCLDEALLPRITPVVPGNMQIAFETFVAPNLEEMRAVLAAKATPPARVDSPHAQLGEHLAGQGRYLWVVNQLNQRRADAQFEPLPLAARLHLPETPVVYDVFERRLVTEREVALQLAPGDAKLYARLPAPIATVAIDRLEWQGDGLDLEATVNGPDGALPAILPVTIAIAAPGAARLLELHRATDATGRLRLHIPLGAAMPAGEYAVEVRENIAGQAARQTVAATPTARPPSDPGPVEIIDRNRLAAFRDRPGEALILYGNEPQKKLAETLAAQLGRPERPLRPVAADDFQKHIDIVISGQIFNLFSNFMVFPLAIHQDTIVLGSPATNSAMKRLFDPFRLEPWPEFAKTPVGNGRALLWWAADAFGLDHDIVAVYAEDDAGLERAVKTLAELWAGK